MKKKKCLNCDHVFRKTESYMDHIRGKHPEVLIGKKKSTKTTRVAKLNLVRLPEKLIKNCCSNFDEVDEYKVTEIDANQNPDENKHPDGEDDMDDSSLNFQITETTSIETMDTELSNECISDKDESSLNNE